MSKFAAYGDLRARLQGLEFDNFALLLQNSAASRDLEAYFSRYLWVTLYFGETAAAAAIVANARRAGLENGAWDAAVSAYRSGDPREVANLVALPWAPGIEAIVADAVAAWRAAYADRFATCYREMTVEHAAKLHLDPAELGWPVENGIVRPPPPAAAAPRRLPEQETELLVRAADLLSQ